MKTKLNNYIPVGVLFHRNLTGIFVKHSKTVGSQFHIVWSNDEAHYKTVSKEVIIFHAEGKKEIPKYCSNFHFSKSVEGWVATYIRETKDSHKKTLVIATSKDLYVWTIKSSLDIATSDTALVVNANAKSNYDLYMGGLFITHARSKDLKHWAKESGLLFTSRHKEFDAGTIRIMGATNTKKGILVVYDASRVEGFNHLVQAGAVLFSKDEPGKIVWRSDLPIWKALIAITNNNPLYPLGLISEDNRTTLFWGTEDGSILTATLTTPFTIHTPTPHPVKEKVYLKRHTKNPIIAPHDLNEWENEAVFNPAAIYDGGRVHLLYRAIGRSGISVLGYASSEDGFDFTDRLDHPVFEPIDDYGTPDPKADTGSRYYNPLLYTSGGGWSGCEDPRAVKIGKRIYVTYLAFGGWNSMRLALTSIGERDLHNRRWKWTKPQFISPPGQVHKNWVLFPEKVNGKFAVLHSISPDIKIHYANSLREFDGETFIKSSAPRGGRLAYWDTKVRGVGPPPLKTKLGWLILYHANDAFDPHKYKLGAMILDSKDPQKVIYRTSHPILCPDMHYENDGKPGVVYASGAVIKDDKLLVYYGGGDKVVCVASAPLTEFLAKVKEDVQIELNPKQSLII
jgi:beta-1,2-mannobiose phosphorylase / 1,2-beta-oligomannan phosphorylase